MPNKLYLYCVIKADEDKEYGPVGLSTTGAPLSIHLKSIDNLGVVYSHIDLEDEDEIQPTRKNLINHQKVTESILQEASVLPFSFGMVVDDMDKLEDLIAEQGDELKQKLDKIEGKIELSLKIMWENMEPVFAEVVTENAEIQQKREFLAKHNIQDQNEKIALGRMVEEALTAKKDWMLSRVITKLSSKSLDHRVLKNVNDEMFANLAFLIDKNDEKAFDESVNALSEEMTENIKFKYVGPLAPYNFL